MYVGRRPNAPHGTATNSDHPCHPVAASNTRQPPATEAHETKLERALRTMTGEPDIVRKARSSFVSWASVAGGCLVFDAATGWHGWSLFVAVPWGAFGLLPTYMKLWNAGYSWRDVLRRPAAADAVEARFGAPGARSPDLPPARADEFGRQT